MAKVSYFFNIQTGEELKKAYKAWAVKLHPDNGGDAEKFKEMQAQFTQLFNVLKNVHAKKDGTTWEATGDRASNETPEEFMNIIEKLMFIQDIDVELCGSWIWVSGNTKEYKELLKELGFKFSGNKKMWYWQNDGVRRYHKKAWTIDEIRQAYGSKVYKQDELDALEG